MLADQPPAQGSEKTAEKPKLKLYIYGSCQSDQYYHPNGDNQSKRPICLSEVEKFNIEDEDNEAQGEKIINNPLFRVDIYQVACGALHTVVLTTEGRVFTFGCNDEGALGREGIQKTPIEVRLDGPMDMISAGDNHSVFANSQMGCIYFSGNYKFLRGQKMVEPIKVPQKYDLTNIDTRLKGNTIQKLVSGSNHTAILVAGKIFIRGEPEAHTVGRRINERHKLTSSLLFDSVGLNHVLDVWCGGYHTIAKVKKGDSFAYYAWGLNKHGQLGINNYEENPYPIQIKKIRKFNIKEVAAGTNFTVFLTEAGELYGCGQNDDGQLGLGQDYVYVDSDTEEENKLAQEIKQKMNLDSQPILSQGQPIQELIKAEQPKPQQKGQVIQAQNNQNIAVEPHPQPMKEQVPPKPRLVEQNIYLKSIKRIPLQDKIDQITAGSEFTLGWNSSNLYSWGFGMNYVLLNGQQEDEFRPFKVKPKIINEQRIYQVAAGAQHVAYLSYSQTQQPLQVEMSDNAKRLTLQAKEKLTRRKRKQKN